MAMTTPDLTLESFDYALPEGLIARYPLETRSASRMLVLDRKPASISHGRFTDLEGYLSSGDVLVLNNVKVMPARLIGHREGHTGHVELFLMHPLNTEKTQWQVLMRPAKKLAPGTKVVLSDSFQAEILSRSEGGHGQVALSWPSDRSLEAVLEDFGKMPIPPYMMREAETLDKERYQTVFSKISGAQAAPTAGLHFTQEILDSLKVRGVKLAEVTLHVSAGTFRPVLADRVEDHKMDPEYYEVSEEAAQIIEDARAQGGRVVCVGTTSLKTVETVAKKHNGKMQADSGWSELFIYPGFQFEVANALLTNFHLPKSTLLMLVSAFANRDLIMQAYHQAINEQYRFYSYGDCMLII